VSILHNGKKQSIFKAVKVNISKMETILHHPAFYANVLIFLFFNVILSFWGLV